MTTTHPHVTTDNDTEGKKLPKPPGKWRNKWLAIRSLTHNGVRHRAGDVILGTRLWPSRDTAETMAQADAANDLARGKSHLIQYSGAVSE